MKPLALCTALLLAGCFVSPQEDVVRVALEVGLPAPMDVPAQTPVAADDAWDLMDRFHLAKFSRFIRVAVEVEDYELATGSWPAHPASEAKSWALGIETETPVVELAVPAGPRRRITALAYDVQPEGLTCYEPRAPAMIDLLAGKDLGAEVEMIPATTGSAAISVQCEERLQRPYIKAQLSIVDARAQVVLPPRPLEGTAPIFGTLQWEGLPLGRPFRMRLMLINELSGSYRILELLAPTFTLTDGGELQGVKVEVSCGS